MPVHQEIFCPSFVVYGEWPTSPGEFVLLQDDDVHITINQLTVRQVREIVAVVEPAVDLAITRQTATAQWQTVLFTVECNAGSLTISGRDRGSHYRHFEVEAISLTDWRAVIQTLTEYPLPNE